MPQFFQDNIPLLQRDTGTQISMPATYNGQLARARVAGQGYRWSSALACNLATTGLGGLDTGALAANTLYHVYLCVSSNIVGLVVSANGPSTGPTGFSQNRYVGRLRTQSGSANVAELAVVNVIVGSGDEIPMPIVGEWQSYTPTVVSGWTGGTLGGRYRRVGSNMDVEISIVSPTSWTGNIEARIPTGFTVDTTAIPAAAPGERFPVGQAVFVDDSASTRYLGTVVYYTTTSVRIWSTAGVDVWAPTAGRPVAGQNGADAIHLTMTVPITEWQGLFS